MVDFNEIINGSDLIEYSEELLAEAIEAGMDEKYTYTIDNGSNWPKEDKYSPDVASMDLNTLHDWEVLECAIDEWIKIRDFISDLKDYNTNIEHEVIIPYSCFTDYSVDYANDQINCSFSRNYFDYGSFEDNFRAGFQEVAYNGSEYFIRVN